MVNNQYVLMESALGFSLFRVIEAEEINIDALSKSIKTYNLFKNMVKLESFQAFTNQEEALESMNKISEGLIPEPLLLFLKTSIPDLSKSKTKDKKDICLGIADANLGNAILEQFTKINKKRKVFTCRCDDIIMEIIRGCRQYLGLFIKSQNEASDSSFNVSNIEHSYIALGHSYSRAKIKYNVNRVDNMIIQAICILDQIDKDINTYCMRCKEWYGWHFPELTKIINDQIQYAKVMRVIKEKSNLKVLYDDDTSDTKAEKLKKDLLDAVDGDEDTYEEIVNTSKTSMGIDVSKIDMIEMVIFATRIVRLAEFRVKLYQYLCDRMDSCAPNLTALIGEQVGARLISKAGSLIKLAKYPASTLQILGAEKALFRALKSKGKCNTPKYGLIYNSTFIMKAKDKNKGRISRYLANKAAMAVRLDCFLDKPTNVYGVAFKNQVEQRLTFFKEGKVPEKNIDVMNKIKMQLQIDEEEEEDVDLDKDEDIDLEFSLFSNFMIDFYDSFYIFYDLNGNQMDCFLFCFVYFYFFRVTPPNTESGEKKKKKKKDKKRKLEAMEAEQEPPTKKQKTDDEDKKEKKKKKKKKKDKKKKNKDKEEVEARIESTPPQKKEESDNGNIVVSEKKKDKKKKKKKKNKDKSSESTVTTTPTDDGSKKKKKKKKKKKNKDKEQEKLTGSQEF